MNYRISLFAILLAIFLICGCENRMEPVLPFKCKIGEDYTVNRKLSFVIDSLRDYRCPEGVDCFWAGDVSIFITIFSESHPTDTFLYLYKNKANPIRIAGYEWKVMDVTPYPDISEPTNPGDNEVILLLLKT